MDLGRPLDVVTASLDAEVLTVLVLPLGRELTTGDVQRLVERRFGERRSIPGLRRTLDRLAAQGVVDVRRAGRIGVYSFNEDHLAAEHIIGLARQRDRLRERLGEEVAAWPVRPVHGALIDGPPPAGGPGASDAFNAPGASGASDDAGIHLLLVAPWSSGASSGPGTRERWDAAVDVLVARVATWTGARVVVHTCPADLVDPAVRAVLRAAHHDGGAFAGPTPGP